MDYSILIWLPPAGMFAFLAARVVIDTRRLEQELANRQVAGLQDMVEMWRQSRKLEPGEAEPMAVQKDIAITASKTGLEFELSRVRAVLPCAAERDTASQREVRLAMDAMSSAMKAHPDLFQKIGR